MQAGEDTLRHHEAKGENNLQCQKTQCKMNWLLLKITPIANFNIRHKMEIERPLKLGAEEKQPNHSLSLSPPKF